MGEEIIICVAFFLPNSAKSPPSFFIELTYYLTILITEIVK